MRTSFLYVAFSFVPLFAVIAEADQSVKVEGKKSCTGWEHAIGPTISWVGGMFWVSIGAVFGLNERTGDRQVRFIIGMPFQRKF